ncbi:hypothetical protein E7T06_07215 [Deinococcus sp. Arct2-2]|uniref:hypothetical protein n=1 Tax=Deinococcus sp. Arct2-2 TaxID=2568653 RepID=UPI0010A37A0C|nr:hypothetical protein [Deinococcus sp. Arct2-2]THF70487.1 hypothetical protein E7T06_07215 [Deinococcus sp. Arct2-2]
MAKKLLNRAARRAHLQSSTDEGRDRVMEQEERGEVEITPKQWKQLDPAPWYLPELGLEREPFMGLVPRYQVGVIIRKRRPAAPCSEHHG